MFWGNVFCTHTHVTNTQVDNLELGIRPAPDTPVIEHKIISHAGDRSGTLMLRKGGSLGNQHFVNSLAAVTGSCAWTT